MFWIFLLMLLNFGISWWNAVVAGKSWVEANAVGGFPRLVVWATAVQSAFGFTMVFAIILIFGAAAVGWLHAAAVNALLNATYILVIFPLLGSGLIITAESWRIWWRDRSLANLGVSGYNTFATIYNSYQAFEGLGPAFKSVSRFFDNNDNDDEGALGLLLILMALVGGIMLTASIIKRHAGTVPISRSH